MKDEFSEKGTINLDKLNEPKTNLNQQMDSDANYTFDEGLDQIGFGFYQVILM